jgi:nitroimidazol reductase NimA-like FMN-containing flavoprotein (pyridoxamine 5'-phosphate oxidase superfamily)
VILVGDPAKPRARRKEARMPNLRKMDPAECQLRLESQSGGVGRLAFNTETGPTIYPVNFTIDGQSVVFRTSPHTELGALGWGMDVAFEVDHLDPKTREGWSVVVKGYAETVDNPADQDRLRSLRRQPQPWAEGGRPMYVRIPWREITGRVVGRDWLGAPRPDSLYR